MPMSRTMTGLVGLGLLTLGVAGGWHAALLTIEDPSRPSPSPSTVSSEDKGLKRIIILSNSSTPFWETCRMGVSAANTDLALKETGLRAFMEGDDGTVEGQISKLSRFAGQSDIAAIGISALEADNPSIARELRAFKEKGVPVITLDSDMDRDTYRDTRVAFVGTDNLAAGRVLGRCAKTLRPEGGEYIAFVARTSAQNAVERLKGFAEGAGDKFKSLGSIPDNHDRAIASENVRNAIHNHPDLHTLVGIYSIDAPAIGEVIKEADRKKDFTVVGFDADPKAIDLMDGGLIDVLVVQNPYEMGYQGVRLLKALVDKDQATIKKMLPKFGEKGGDIYDTGVRVVVPEKGSPLKADQFDKQTEFLKIGDFHQWLFKHKLPGS